MATLEPHDRITGSELSHDRLDGLAVVPVDVLDQRPSQQLFQGVSEDAWQRRIGALEVPVEPRDAEPIMRKVEEPH
jgi:hypothetical protein